MYAQPQYDYAPYATGPQMAPYGVVGDMLGAIGRPAGRVLGNHFGYGNIGENLGRFAGSLAQEFLPFSAGPQYVAAPQSYAQPEMNPYGFWGNAISAIAPTAGRMIGRAFGNEATGHTVGQVIGGGAKFLPFSAGVPQPIPAPIQYAQPEMNPYGFWGNAISAIAPTAGRMIGRAFGNEATGHTVGQVIGGGAKFLPFSTSGVLDPSYGYQPVAQPLHDEMNPYGIGGAILGAFAPGAGAAIGRHFGNERLGRTIGSIAGTAAAFLPFSVGPGQVAYLPVDTPQVH